MSKNCFEALGYMHSREDENEKNILFEYIFERKIYTIYLLTYVLLLLT